MAFLITHFYEGGTAEQYQVVLQAAHPGGVLPPGQTFHAAGPTEGGWLIAAVWDSQQAFESFLTGTLLPTLQTLSGGFAGPPQQRTSELTNVITS